MSRARPITVFLAAVLATGTAFGEEVKKLEPVVVTATKVETPQGELGASVTVITEEELRIYNYDRIEDALRQVPGVVVQRSGGPGKVTSIQIRGAGSQQVQVLVDGMRVKSPTLGTADLAEFSLDAIDRIEIVRGPQSTLHGADAIGGVVNIITKKGQGPVRATLSVEGGSYETFREQATVGGSRGGFNFFLSGSRFDTAGQLRQFSNDDSDQTAFAGRLGYDFPWKGDLSLSGRYTKLDLDLPIHSTSPTILDPNSQQQTETWLYNLSYKQPVTSWWDVQARYGQWWNNQGFQDPPPPPPPTDTFADTPGDSQTNTRRREFELLSSFRPAKWNTFTVGGEHRNERGESRGAFSEEINTVSLFGQDEIRLFDRVILGGGLRWEDNDVFGSEVTPRVSAAILIKETGTRLRGGWGKGFRAPTINDLFFPGFGNPDLKPERSESYEVGADQKLWENRLRFGATYFHNEFSNLIQFTFDPATFAFLPENVSGARSQGVETYLELDPLDWVTLFVNYTFTDTRDTTTGLDLRRFPRHAWSTGVTVTPVDRLSLWTKAYVVSSQLESAFAGRNPGYHRMDVGGTYRLLGRVGAMQKLELTARVENLTDEKYEEALGFPALGFNAMVGLRASFE
ncbi:MAG: TonB-dependent receptor [Candidatus Rokubacteria bacterium]|nr:TonB-dependent receptor [Candidatus Rokubacteria bacterium]